MIHQARDRGRSLIVSIAARVGVAPLVTLAVVAYDEIEYCIAHSCSQVWSLIERVDDGVHLVGVLAGLDLANVEEDLEFGELQGA